MKNSVSLDFFITILIFYFQECFSIVCNCSCFRIPVTCLPESSFCFVSFCLEVFFCSLHCLRLLFFFPTMSVCGDSGCVSLLESVAVNSWVPARRMAMGGACWQMGFPVGQACRNWVVLLGDPQMSVLQVFSPGLSCLIPLQVGVGAWAWLLVSWCLMNKGAFTKSCF